MKTTFQALVKQCGACAAAFCLIQSGIATAQKLPDVVAAPKGMTINISLQTGTKSNLSFGTNTSFGSNLSTQSSPGMTTTAVSSFTPLQASITSQIGDGPAKGKTTANIANLRAQGTGETNIAGKPISAKDANFASGEAVLDGVGASVKIDLNPLKSAFIVETAPNIVGGVACNSASTTACSYSKTDGTKPYSDIQISSGNSGGNITSTTTVDIGTSQFTSSFAQSF
jgi:hypothetical protein